MSAFDDIRSLANEIIQKANALEASLPPPSAPAWPSGVDCLAGTLPTPMPVMIPAEQDISYYDKKVFSFNRIHLNSPPGSIVFLGDSITEGMAINSVSPYGLNFGISGDTMRGVLNRINSLGSQNTIHRAGAGVLLIGINDICFEGVNAYGNCTFMWNLLASWMTGKWVIVLTLPINETMFTATTNAEIDSINDYAKTKFANRAGFTVIDTKPTLAPSGQLLPAYTIDGIHLSATGYDALRPLIKAALAKEI